MSLRNSLASLALVGLVSVASTQAANAAVILTFGQVGDTNTITGTNNGAGSTTIATTDTTISISQILAAGIVTPVDAFLTLSATSDGAATDLGGGAVTQEFNGSFSIWSGAGQTGTNYLSGTFTDAVFGAGASLTLSAGEPPDSISFSSDVIAPADLDLARGIALSFANVTPGVAIVNGSLRSFTSSVSGTFSANVGEIVPEPASLFLLGSGLAMLAARRARRQKA